MEKRTFNKALIAGMFKALKVIFILISGIIIAIVTTLLGLLGLMLGFIRSGSLKFATLFQSAQIKKTWMQMVARRNARLSALQKILVNLTTNR